MTKNILNFIIYFLAFFFIATGFWVFRYFGAPSFEQILYHFQFGVEGVVHADQEVLNSFLRWCILVPLFYASISCYISKKISFLSKPIFLTSFLIFSVMFCLNKLSFFPYLEYTQEGKEDFFIKHYVDPKTVNITHNGKLKNLILIYVESLEDSFADESLFGENLLSALDVNKIGGKTFKKFKSVPTTGWTSGAIVSSQCAVPLRALLLSDKGGNTGFSSKSAAIKMTKNFMPGAICLGDVLKSNGYRNIFITGPDLNFAGVGSFLSSHGYDEIYGKEEMIANGALKEETKSWGGGLHDNDLFELAKEIIKKNESMNLPYNLTILTVDMHSPYGNPSPKCATDNKLQLSNAIKCTANGLANLIKYIKENGYLENTNLVIMGDHLFMSNGEQGALYFYKERNIFNRFISKDNDFELNRDEIIHFDMLPTILYSLGFSFPNNRLGLGHSGFGDLTTPLDHDRLEQMNKSLMNYSSSYLDLWKPVSQTQQIQ